ncbi:hypothetical protein PG993_005542 [Apiospora rasikravindrae]|uniref:Uncharacterized protein n=1 Tax=Apiospora rasikravindrae TaxID=990691 RepID=A0ABR1TFW7_9PEZI
MLPKAEDKNNTHYFLDLSADEDERLKLGQLVILDHMEKAVWAPLDLSVPDLRILDSATVLEDWFKELGMVNIGCLIFDVPLGANNPNEEMKAKSTRCFFLATKRMAQAAQCKGDERVLAHQLLSEYEHLGHYAPERNDSTLPLLLALADDDGVSPAAACGAMATTPNQGVYYLCLPPTHCGNGFDLRTRRQMQHGLGHAESGLTVQAPPLGQQQQQQQQEDEEEETEEEEQTPRTSQFHESSSSVPLPLPPPHDNLIH